MIVLGVRQASAWYNIMAISYGRRSHSEHDVPVLHSASLIGSLIELSPVSASARIRVRTQLIWRCHVLVRDRTSCRFMESYRKAMTKF